MPQMLIGICEHQTGSDDAEARLRGMQGRGSWMIAASACLKPVHSRTPTGRPPGSQPGPHAATIAGRGRLPAAAAICS